MDNREQLRRITELTKQIAGLPKGYLSKKTIGGKVYYYHQWSENGVKQSRYLHDSEIAPLADKIEKRKELQAQLRILKSQKSRRNEATGMKCTFMHKRTPVAELELDDVTGFIQRIGSVYAPEHLPIGIPVRNEIADRAAFNDWWRDRIRKESSLNHYNMMNVLSMHALMGAYKPEGYEWADELCEVLTGNIDFACDYIANHFEGVKVAKPEGTYMLFVDCTDWCAAHGKTIEDVEQACWDVGVAIQDGRMFHGPCHLRMNLASPRSRIEEAFRRMDQYVFNA